MSSESSTEAFDGGGGHANRDMPDVVMALAFATEFSTNAAIFLRAVSTLGIVVQSVDNHETRLAALEGDYSSLEGRVSGLESQVGEIEGLESEIERLEGELAACGGNSIRDENDSVAALTGTATENYYARRYGD